MCVILRREGSPTRTDIRYKINLNKRVSFGKYNYFGTLQTHNFSLPLYHEYISSLEEE